MLRGNSVKHDFGCKAVFTEQDASASQNNSSKSLGHNNSTTWHGWRCKRCSFCLYPSYVHDTADYRQYVPCWRASQCLQVRCPLPSLPPLLLPGRICCGRPARFKIAPGGTVCKFGDRTFVSESWLCKQQSAFFSVVKKHKLFLLMLD